MSEKVIHRGLDISAPPAETTYVMGSGQATARFGAAAAPGLNPSGNWRKWSIKEEFQRMYGLETMGCAIFAPIKAWIRLAKFYGFTDFPDDGSERYGGVWCNVTPTGSDPHDNVEIMRTLCGIVPQLSMPWTPDIKTLAAYYNVEMARSLLPLGSKLLDRFELGYEQVWEWKDRKNLTGKQKTALLKTALTRGTVCVSVSGDYRTRNSAYYKEPGDPDTHFLELVDMESTGARIVDDQYDPTIKRFEKDYDHEIALVFFLKRKEEVKRTWWSIIWDLFAKLQNKK